MRRAVIAILVLAGISAWAVAGPPKQLTWDFEGYPAVVAAASKAKLEKRRLLLGLSGGDT